jgi:hypothetical protein
MELPPWRMETRVGGGVRVVAAMEKGATTVDPEKGAAVIVKEVGGHALASSHPASSRHHR